jgi:chromosome segregation ATPase
MNIRLLIFALTALVLSSGCVTTRETPAQAEARRREAMVERERRLAEEEARRSLQMTLEDTDSQVHELRQEMGRMRRDLNQAQAADVSRLETRIGRLEQQLNALERQREKDREEIIAILSNRMAELMQQSRPAAGAGGRVHTVASGETLSAIAAAWGVNAQAIIRANNLQNPDRLRVGQTLTIP